MVKIESILHFLEETLRVSTFPDYPGALNGLQVSGAGQVARVGAAVDASEQTIVEAVRLGVDFLLVHHGLFWGGLGPITGARYRKVGALVKGGVALYSAHLPLDAHPEVGNNAIIVDRLGLGRNGAFGIFQGVEVGWWAQASLDRRELKDRLEKVVAGAVRLIPGGPSDVRRVGVLSGGASSALPEAAALGLDTLITGEAPHHAYHEAMELGLNLLLGGHYATETFGVKALAESMAERFNLPWDFVHFPTGL